MYSLYQNYNIKLHMISHNKIVIRIENKNYSLQQF